MIQQDTSPAPLNFGSRKQISLGIQKKGGHLYEKSLRLLNSWGYGELADAGARYKNIAMWKNSRQPRLLMCRLEDIVDNVSIGALDAGIVSSDVLNKWRLAQQETTKRTRFFYEDDIGPAGSNLRLGVSMAALNRWTGNCQQSFADYKLDAMDYWRDAVSSTIYGSPLVTSDKGTLINFLKLRQVRCEPENILERRGTIEAQGKLMGAPAICDLVELGQTMRENGYVPVEEFEIAASRMVLIANKPVRSADDEKDFAKRKGSFVRFLMASNTDSVPA